MTDVDPAAKALNSIGNSSSNLQKKSGRKSKAPVYRGLTPASSPASPRTSAGLRRSRESPLTDPASSPEAPQMPSAAMLTMKKPEAIMANPGQQQQGQQPIKSYSDFMRSLAAKYNNNE